jgi:hypothetical protein
MRESILDKAAAKKRKAQEHALITPTDKHSMKSLKAAVLVLEHAMWKERKDQDKESAQIQLEMRYDEYQKTLSDLPGFDGKLVTGDIRRSPRYKNTMTYKNGPVNLTLTIKERWWEYLQFQKKVLFMLNDKDVTKESDKVWH